MLNEITETGTIRPIITGKDPGKVYPSEIEECYSPPLKETGKWITPKGFGLTGS